MVKFYESQIYGKNRQASSLFLLLAAVSDENLLYEMNASNIFLLLQGFQVRLALKNVLSSLKPPTQLLKNSSAASEEVTNTLVFNNLTAAINAGNELVKKLGAMNPKFFIYDDRKNAYPEKDFFHVLEVKNTDIDTLKKNILDFLQKNFEPLANQCYFLYNRNGDIIFKNDESVIKAAIFESPKKAP
ncbi:hypothetical protein [Legionella gresilensis]|uniref:hypothetical protein n=1 Tax=Legionella gresilensis TaxID=91823 RepID=UPI001041B322|nr:hypothetical protein [Legionella gresilensis]